MKIENFKRVKEIIDEINAKEATVKGLNENTVAEIWCGRKFYTIGIGSTCDHDYAEQATALIDYIKSDLSGKINTLKSELEAL